MTPTQRHDAFATLRHARRQLALGRPAAAAAIAGRLAQRWPAFVPARLLLARIDLAAERPEAAMAHLDTADWYLRADVGSHRRLRRALLLRGQALMQLDRPDDAAEAWRAALQLEPRCATALRRLARWELDHDRPAAGLKLAGQLLNCHGPKPANLGLLADAAEAAGEIDQALDALAKLRRGRAATPRQARLLARAGREAEALDAYAALIDQHPHDIDLLVESIAVHERLGEQTALRRRLDAAQRTEPNDRALAAAIATQHMRLGHFAAAGRAWWRLARAGDNAAAWAHALVCAACESRHRLMQRFTAGLDRAEPDDTARRRLVTVAWAVATPGQTRRCFVEHHGEPDQAGPLTCLIAEAQEVFEQVLDEHEHYADLHYHLSVCHGARGERAGQAECLDRALGLNPGYLAAAEARVALLLARRRFKQASRIIAAAEAAKGPGQTLCAMHLALAAARDQPADANDPHTLEHAARLLDDAHLDAQARTLRTRSTAPAHTAAAA